MAEIPKVLILDPIKPDPTAVDAERLSYPKLLPAVTKHRPFEYERINKLWDVEDALDEEQAARQLANQYLLMTAQRLQEVGSEEPQQLLSERFTQQSIELFGAPNAAVAQDLVIGTLISLEGLQVDESVDSELLSFLINTLSAKVANPEQKSGAELDYKPVAEVLNQQLSRRFGAALEQFDADERATFSPQDIVGIFTQSVAKLAENEPAWGRWKIKPVDGATLSVSAGDEVVKVGRERARASRTELKGLFGHEVLVHGLKGLNARKAGDSRLASGLPGYLEAEEGMGVLIEYAITGIVPQKNIDRYIDIAFALGTVGEPTPRQELFEIVMARNIVRQQAEGGRPDYEALAAKTWEHVNRIYRGSRGDGHIGVFTKDISYFEGFHAMAQYVQSAIENGTDPSDLFDYLMQGKFDPTNQLHSRYVAAS